MMMRKEKVLEKSRVRNIANYLGHVIATACRGIPSESVNEALQKLII